jgi:hypothetical protein
LLRGAFQDSSSRRCTCILGSSDFGTVKYFR